MRYGRTARLGHLFCFTAFLFASGNAHAQQVAISSVGERAASVCAHGRAPNRDRAVANDNRIAQGSVRNDTLSLHLVMRSALWYPEGPAGCALPVHVFAEEGAKAQVPGPLLRVRAGAMLHVTVRNALPYALWVRGLQDRDAGRLDSAEIVPGATRAFAFRASVPGAWYYWAGGASARVPASGPDGQLVGALVVDSALDRDAARPRDRVFVLTRWTPDGQPGNRGFQLNAINGRSWPHTERLTYTVGDSIRWQVINASDELHMMHLHGFYYRVASRGDATHDSALARAQQNAVVTVAVRRGEWMSTIWTAERDGNWLFHCHILSHMSGDQRITPTVFDAAGPVDAAHHASADSPQATHAMAGLVLGVTIRPARHGPRAGARALGRAREVDRRVIHLYANTRPRVFGDRPGFGFVVQDSARPPGADSVRIPGSPIVLTRGAPVAIVVHNRIGTPMGVHWHGIELESYYDGVPGWSGTAARLAPMIAPGDSFVARFTPPRAGTFMYHVHSERGEELASGLYGAIIVLEPGQVFDRDRDRVLVIGTGGPGADAPTVIDGSAAPDTMRLRSGVSYRLRVIDISANDAHVVSIRGLEGLATWRPLARDGRDLAPNRQVVVPARENMSAGITRDFEFTPPAPASYALTAVTVAVGNLTDRVVTLPILVGEPPGQR